MKVWIIPLSINKVSYTMANIWWHFVRLEFDKKKSYRDTPTGRANQIQRVLTFKP